jgi:hypothetical protein
MSGDSGDAKPNAKQPELKPSKEIEEKMRPLAREQFFGLLRRAANSPAPTTKQT